MTLTIDEMYLLQQLGYAFGPHDSSGKIIPMDKYRESMEATIIYNKYKIEWQPEYLSLLEGTYRLCKNKYGNILWENCANDIIQKGDTK